MTIGTSIRVAGPFVGDGSTVLLDFNYKVFDDAEVQVLSRLDSSGVDTALVLGVDYTVALNSNQDVAPGGRVTLTSALPTGRTGFIVSQVSPLQETVFTNTGGFYPTVLNDSLDRLHALHLENRETNSRAVVTPVGETGNLALPPVANRVGKYLYFDPNGDITASDGTDAGTAIAAVFAELTSTAAGKGVELVAGANRVIRPEDYGAVGDGSTNDTTAIQAAIQASADKGLPVVLTDIYKVTSRLNSVAGMVVKGVPGCQIYAGTGAGEFDNTSTYNAADGTVLLITHDDVVIDGVYFKMQYLDEIVASAIVMRSCDRVKIRNCEFSHFAKSKVIRVESCDDFEITDNYIHDVTTDSATTGQVTAIDVDDNRPTGGSNRGKITGNRINDITVGAAFLAAYGYQTDGINISHRSSSHHTITGNIIKTVGEGIDCFGGNNIIANNTIKDCKANGIKLIHGAQQNVVEGNNISDCVTTGIVIAGSTSATQGTNDNLVTGNIIARVDVGSTSTSTSSGIATTNNGGTTYKPNNNTITNNVIMDSAGADWGMEIADTGTGNVFLRNRFLGGMVGGNVTNPNGARYSEIPGAYVDAYANAQSIAPGSFVVVQYANGETDSTSEFDATTYTYTATTQRDLLVQAHVTNGSPTSGKLYELAIYKNGVSIHKRRVTTSSTSAVTVSVSTAVRVAKNDTIDIRLKHNEAGNITLSSSLENSALHITEAG